MAAVPRSPTARRLSAAQIRRRRPSSALPRPDNTAAPLSHPSLRDSDDETSGGGDGGGDGYDDDDDNDEEEAAARSSAASPHARLRRRRRI